MVTARWNGAVIAQSDKTILVEGNHYFPPDAVNAALLEDSKTQTHCPWKGAASYKTIVVDGARNADAAWYYPAPKTAAAHIKDYVAFWKGVEIA
ncbi:DUF427 domain-containing protein [Sphingomonas sp.]|uniref:DUF427 domain-containing protein n=1 Tax=Sphingomonas sp. TaxID=28214 RepID=UPI001D7EE53F|nr:DUF427 domain-containing protein [Sphingomonas sp.]MBX9795812.1 DUF427 domain-containing protein [Sphingomonas sp.]